MVDCCAKPAEVFARREHLSARGDHILYYKESSPSDVPTLGKATGSVLLGPLADEDRRETSPKG